MKQSGWTAYAGWPAAFGASGLLWLAAQFVAFGINLSLPVVLAAGFVVVAVLALAWLPVGRRHTLSGLWVLAIALNTLWMAQLPGEGGLLLYLYGGALVGSLLFTLWVALAVVVLVHLPERGLPRPERTAPTAAEL